jgi:hypothetical protein
VAAAFRARLVLDLDPGDAHPFELSHGSIDREGVAPAGVDVDEQGQVGRAGDPRRVDEDVAEVRDAEVGQAERKPSRSASSAA